MSNKAKTPNIIFDAKYNRIRLNKLAVVKIPFGSTLANGQLLFKLPGNDMEVKLDKFLAFRTATKEKTGGEVYRVKNLIDQMVDSIVKEGERVKFNITDVVERPGEAPAFTFILEPATA